MKSFLFELDSAGHPNFESINVFLIPGDLLCDIRGTYNSLSVFHLSDFKQNGELSSKEESS